MLHTVLIQVFPINFADLDTILKITSPQHPIHTAFNPVETISKRPELNFVVYPDSEHETCYQDTRVGLNMR